MRGCYEYSILKMFYLTIFVYKTRVMNFWTDTIAAISNEWRIVTISRYLNAVSETPIKTETYLAE